MKYMGSKNRIADEIVDVMIESAPDFKVNGTDTFVDAFCGGCSVIERIPTKYKRIANDKQKYLIAMWRRLTKGYSIGLPTTISRELYSDVRDSYNKGDDRYRDDVKGWVGFFISINRIIDPKGVYHYGYLILDKKCKYVGSTADYFPSNHEAANAALESCLENYI